MESGGGHSKHSVPSGFGRLGTDRLGDEMRGIRIIFGFERFRKGKGGIIGIYIVEILGTIIDSFLVSRCYLAYIDK